MAALRDGQRIITPQNFFSPQLPSPRQLFLLSLRYINSTPRRGGGVLFVKGVLLAKGTRSNGTLCRLAPSLPDPRAECREATSTSDRTPRGARQASRPGGLRPLGSPREPSAAGPVGERRGKGMERSFPRQGETERITIFRKSYVLFLQDGFYQSPYLFCKPRIFHPFVRTGAHTVASRSRICSGENSRAGGLWFTVGSLSWGWGFVNGIGGVVI